MTETNMYTDTVLGFAEEAVPDTNDPENLASKAGGVPVWLYRAPARPPKVPKCGVCLQPQTFLLQVYCPLEAEIVGHGDAFHRMLYVAICKQVSCQRLGGGVSVVRGQLQRENSYYGWDGGSCVAEGVTEECVLCGFWGERKCAGCGVRYCGRVCQTEDWKLGHRDVCQGGTCDIEERRREYRFREVEIVTDNHPSPCSSDLEEDDADEEEAECERTEDRRKGLGDASDVPDVSHDESSSHDVSIESKVGTMQDADEDELPEDLFRGKKKDKAFERMRRMMKYAPDQVIRYWRGGDVLWGSEANKCESVNQCENCGGKRVFEFQIMPQLMYYICRKGTGQSIEKIAKRLRDEIDFVTIAVYSCEQSCGGGGGGEYFGEFAWIQTVTQATTR